MNVVIKGSKARFIIQLLGISSKLFPKKHEVENPACRRCVDAHVFAFPGLIVYRERLYFTKRTEMQQLTSFNHKRWLFHSIQGG